LGLDIGLDHIRESCDPNLGGYAGSLAVCLVKYLVKYLVKCSDYFSDSGRGLICSASGQSSETKISLDDTLPLGTDESL
jgi:hypothetical protein